MTADFLQMEEVLEINTMPGNDHHLILNVFIFQRKTRSHSRLEDNTKL